jgi:hypothetical protein
MLQVVSSLPPTPYTPRFFRLGAEWEGMRAPAASFTYSDLLAAASAVGIPSGSMSTPVPLLGTDFTCFTGEKVIKGTSPDAESAASSHGAFRATPRTSRKQLRGNREGASPDRLKGPPLAPLHVQRTRQRNGLVPLLKPPRAAQRRLSCLGSQGRVRDRRGRDAC